MPHRRSLWQAGLLALSMATGAVWNAAAQADESPRGAALFETHCVVCHRAGGVGTPGLAPPLTHTPGRLATSDDGRRQLVWTLLYGMFGSITVDERAYNFKMPYFSKLNDDELASVINYVVGTVATNAAAATVTSAEVGLERGRDLDGKAVHAHRALALGSLVP